MYGDLFDRVTSRSVLKNVPRALEKGERPAGWRISLVSSLAASSVVRLLSAQRLSSSVCCGKYGKSVTVDLSVSSFHSVNFYFTYFGAFGQMYLHDCYVFLMDSSSFFFIIKCPSLTRVNFYFKVYAVRC